MKSQDEALRLDASLMKQITPEVINAAIQLVAERNSGRNKYPLNSFGVPEYRSVLLTLDHLFFSRQKQGIDIQKMVMSIEEPYDAMMALFAYYDEQITPATFKTLLEWNQNRLTDVLVYFTPPTVRDVTGNPVFQIVVGVDLYNRIAKDRVKGKFSHLMTRDAILDEVDKAIALAASKKLQTPSLISVAIYEDLEDAAQDAPPPPPPTAPG